MKITAADLDYRSLFDYLVVEGIGGTSHTRSMFGSLSLFHLNVERTWIAILVSDNSYDQYHHFSYNHEGSEVV